MTQPPDPTRTYDDAPQQDAPAADPGLAHPGEGGAAPAGASGGNRPRRHGRDPEGVRRRHRPRRGGQGAAGGPPRATRCCAALPGGGPHRRPVAAPRRRAGLRPGPAARRPALLHHEADQGAHPGRAAGRAARTRRPTGRRFLAAFEQVCQTLAYAHSKGVIHRDLKPSNVMVGAFGEVQVMDWGLAKVLTPSGGRSRPSQTGDRRRRCRSSRRRAASEADAGEDGSETRAGSVLGTPAYMAPEQARGEVEDVDRRADVFGLGAILCEMLTGKPPFPGPERGGAEAGAAGRPGGGVRPAGRLRGRRGTGRPGEALPGGEARRSGRGTPGRRRRP